VERKETMTDLERWLEDNYPDVYDEWVRCDGDIGKMGDMEDWLEYYYPDILRKYEDSLDGWS